MLHAAHAVSLFPQTLLIETRDEVPRQTMEIGQRIQITSLETGIMDTLFDEGYIVFDRMSTRDKGSTTIMNREAIKFAIERDADLLLVLVPNEEGASWSLVQVENGNRLGDGFADISIIERDENKMKRWISLGNSLAVSALSALDKALRKSNDGVLLPQKRVWRHQQ